MNPIPLLLITIGIYVLGALTPLLLNATARSARQAAGWLGLLASVTGVITFASALFWGESAPSLALFAIAPFGQLIVQMDGLSTLLVGLISLIGVATSLYSMADNPETIQKPVSASSGFFTNLFMGTMLLVVTTSNAFFFLIFWEMMTLASYFLVIWDFEKKEAVRAGFIYLLVAHAGAALIMLAFFLFFQKAGTFDFSAMREAGLSPGVKNLVFLLAFIGFGAKAGMVPLHFWAPDTYAAAPHHVSALMAGVMKKTAVYGLLRVCVDLLGLPVLWWGLMILFVGGLSTIFGAFYALSERDLKRMLAYSSVENVGIILMGVGLGMIGMAAQIPVLAVLGFLAALYHMLNHAFFKGLLFLGAGSVIDQVGTTNLNRMGGLARRMPWTAAAFLIGALSVSAIPPFNGFVSEWFIYQTLFTASQLSLFEVRVLSPLFAILLALAGALAVMVYIKAYGGAFAGPARSQPAGSATEASGLALFSKAYLALGCLALGLGSPLITPWIASVAAGFTHSPAIAVSSGWYIYPAEVNQAVLSTPLVALLLAGLLIVPLIIVAIYRGQRAGRRNDVEPWSCGYGYAAQMSMTAGGFDQPVRVSFQPFYWLRTLVDNPYRVIAGFSRSALHWIERAEPVVETFVTRPTARLVETAGQWIQALQMGDIRVYCLYIIVTLAILLIAIFGRSGL
jgi:hydrogenase-4 component B